MSVLSVKSSPSVHFDDNLSYGLRVKNFLVNNYRGIFGFFVPIIAWLFFLSKKPHVIVRNVWCWMLWSFLLAPVATPVTAFIPLFAFPFCGVIKSDTVCKCYFNEVIALMLVGGWVAMALNNSEFDKRIILWTLSSKSGEISPMALLIKGSIVTYILSMFSRNWIVTKNVTMYISAGLNRLQSETGATRDYNEIRYIICCAIFSSSAIGSIAILNASMPTLCAAGIWSLSGHAAGTLEIFTFLNYSMFAFPTSIVMLIFNLLYFCVLLKIIGKEETTPETRKQILTEIQTYKSRIPPNITACEVVSVLSVIMCQCAYFSRRNTFFGWTSKRSFVKDATVSSIFNIVLHLIPKNLNFLQIFWTKKRSKIIHKPASGMILFRYVNQNTYWGYLVILGSGIALNAGVRASNLDGEQSTRVAQLITDRPWIVTTLIVCFTTVLLSCFMSGTSVLVVLMPLILSSHHKKVYLLAVGMGIGGSLGFTQPFSGTPGYHCCKEGKVPIKKIIKYGIVNSILCMIVLWIALTFLAEICWGNIEM